MEKKKDSEEDMDKYIRKRYETVIDYYWRASRSNKRWYKITHSLTVIFGALVTLIASLTSSKIIDQSAISSFFILGTPVLAALLTIIAGFSQSFQWGGTWQKMVITAEQLQKEYDLYILTPSTERNYVEEAEKLNSIVITETLSFFERLLGAVKTATKTANKDTMENDRNAG